MFEERNQTERVIDTDHLRKKEIKEPETEWQKTVKSKKGDEYYGKLREVIVPTRRVTMLINVIHNLTLFDARSWKRSRSSKRRG